MIPEPTAPQVTPYTIASRFIGVKEVPGKQDNPMILAMLKLDNEWPDGDEVPWCSAFMNFVCWLLRLPRSKNLRARSWLGVGRPVAVEEAAPGYDVVILSRSEAGEDPPGPEVIDAPGHVGLFAGIEGRNIQILGGNQGNQVCVASFDKGRVLGVRRLIV